jgi:ATP-dependent RNA helicase DDX60
MDLEEFDNLPVADENKDEDISKKDASPLEALKFVDAKWYTPVGRRARWMDLIGDYAGSEPFVIDGQFEMLSRLIILKPTLECKFRRRRPY